MEGKEYKSVRDFLDDESFRAWVDGNHQKSTFDWEYWVAQHPEKHQLVESAILILEGPEISFEELPVDSKMVRAEWEKLRTALERRRLRAAAGATRSVESKPLRPWLKPLRIAASIALILSLSLMTWEWGINPVVEHQTPYGQQLSLLLADSTRVDLNANSTLRYRKQNPRKVWLDGEAFFHVKKKPMTDENFRVITDDLTVEVLGTSFNVVENDDKTEVVLAEGSIKLDLNREADSELYMEPGDLVTFSSRTGAPATKEKIKAASRTSWKDGILQFEDVPLFRVMQRIEDIYGWQAEYVDDDLQNRKISTPLPANDLESALTLLSRAIGIEIEKVESEKRLLLR